MRRRLSLILGLLLLLVSLMPSRAAALADVQLPEALDLSLVRLRGLGVVKGDPLSGLMPPLMQTITRAELAVLVVRAFGRGGDAERWTGQPPFADVEAESWYAPWVATASAIAAEQGVTLGVGDGRFEPNRPVTRSEALVMALKLVGWKVQETQGAWYQPWWQRAVEAGLIAAADADAIRREPDGPTRRGVAFWLIDKVFFAELLPDGASVYTKYLDGLPPELVLDHELPAVTTAESVQISGRVVDNRGVLEVRVNGRPVALEGDRFSFTESLVNAQNRLVLTATDLAGNQVSRTYVVSRVP